ncbi:ATP-binding protein [Rhizobiaceae bacterium BDR2-2]|uniref:ATP-binding protein n=1 Tax=Ectorhizobium quercum TaxID=2965071 RepID=A0AAE3N7I3_9HYPH|nr:ATP-binding protein [Ectorhizobium quercum]MCX9000007.1 ATP-binding protein [Ectorhizobium quercum]
MMKGGDFERLIGKARRFAALSVSFKPLDAVRAALGAEKYEASTAAILLAKLQADCVTSEPGFWVMRPSPREKTLLATDRSVALEGLSTPLPQDEASVFLRDTYLGDSGPIRELLNRLVANPFDAHEQLGKLLATFSQLGRATELYNRIPELRSALNRADGVVQSDSRLATGFFGHKELREELADWIDNPPRERMARAFYISGLPGVGKSFLMAKVVQEARARKNPVVLTLDFDRRGLNLLDTDSLTLELARQVSDELPQHAPRLSELRVELSKEASGRYRRSGSLELPTGFAEAMRVAVQESGRPVLLVLDTLEVLRGYGETHPARLFSYIDQFIRSEIGPMSIIAAGRGDALAPVDPFRIGETRLLTGLEDATSAQLLTGLNVPFGRIQDIVDRARGNPLLLRLGAKLALDSESLTLDWQAGDRPELAGAYLYRAILSRIEDDGVRNVANFGLVMRQVDADAIREVIAPGVQMQLRAGQAEALLTDLRTNHWLVVDEAQSGWVRHRSDMRQAMLPMIYEDAPTQAAEINRRAVKFFEGRVPELQLYHRLQLIRSGDPLVNVSPQLARSFDDAMIEELPAIAADAVRLARGQRSFTGLSQTLSRNVSDRQPIAPGQQPPDRTMVRDLELLLEQGDLTEADRLYEALFTEMNDLKSPAGAVALCHRWMSGQWSSASKQFKQLTELGYRLEGEGHSSLYRLVVLEMRAEFGFQELAREMSLDGQLLLNAQSTYGEAQGRRLNDGPLAFAMLAADGSRYTSNDRRDRIGAAATGLDDASLTEFARSDMLALRERYGIETLPHTQAHDYAAVLNPYSRPVGTLFALKRSPRMLDYLNGIMTNFDQVMDSAFNIGESGGPKARLLSDPTQGIDYLAAVGATADWLGAFSFFHSTAHVPMLARRAERWRKAAAGSWTFGGRPPNKWRDQSEELDRGMYQWFEKAVGHQEAVQEAARQFLFWAFAGRWSPDAGWLSAEAYFPEIGERAQARIFRAMSQGKQAGFGLGRLNGHLGCLREMQRIGVARSIAVPLTILAMDAGDGYTPDDEFMTAFKIVAGPEVRSRLY